MLTLVRVHALLHRASRETDDDGRVVATIDDYAAVRDLVAGVIAEGVNATVSPIVRETVEVIEQAPAEGFTVTAVAKQLDLDKGTVSRRLRRAHDGGYVKNLEEKRGQPGRWVVDDPLPDNTDVLPDPDELRGGAW